MSDFFANLHQKKEGPIGRFNEVGPLPPAGLDGLFGPLSEINSAAESLLGSHVQPYNQDPSFSQEPSYLEIPHSIPKVIPAIMIPNADGTAKAPLTRSVNYGDVAWTMRSPDGIRRHFTDRAPGASRWGDFPRDPIINVSTANYLLRGLQRWADADNIREKEAGYWWVVFRNALNVDLKVCSQTMKHTEHTEVYKRKLMNIFRPFGVVHGSNRQGGQHQGGSIVTWATDYVSTLVVDGKVQNLSNYWRHSEIWAGDDLRFELRWVDISDKKDPLSELKHYTLTSVPKSMRTETFGVAPHNSNEHRLQGFYQFVPTTSRNNFHAAHFWHVARSRVTFGSVPSATMLKSMSDETQLSNGVVLEVTWNPYENCEDSRLQHLFYGFDADDPQKMYKPPGSINCLTKDESKQSIESTFKFLCCKDELLLSTEQLHRTMMKCSTIWDLYLDVPEMNETRNPRTEKGFQQRWWEIVCQTYPDAADTYQPKIDLSEADKPVVVSESFKLVPGIAKRAPLRPDAKKARTPPFPAAQKEALAVKDELAVKEKTEVSRAAKETIKTKGTRQSKVKTGLDELDAFLGSD